MRVRRVDIRDAGEDEEMVRRRRRTRVRIRKENPSMRENGEEWRSTK